MRIRLIYAIGSLALFLILSGLGWHALRSRNNAPVESPKAGSPISPKVDTPQASQTAQPEPEDLSSEEQVEKGEDITSEVIGITRGTKNDSYAEKLQKALETPEYQVYLKKQQETFGMDLELWWDFLESQGLGSGRRMQERDFNALFPDGGDSSDYEPEMRKKFAELVLENPLKDTGILLGEFWQEKANYIWTREHFNGHSGDYDWAENIRQNAASILTKLETAEVETTPVTTIPDSMPEPSSQGVAEETRGTQPPTREEPGTPTETLEPILHQSTQEPQTDLTTDIPNLPNSEDFEKALRIEVSSQQFKTAMQILTQYGPKEGLRRLKTSDPDMATQVEQLLQRHTETD